MEEGTEAAPDARLALLAREDPGGPAFRTLYERHRGPVYGLLLRLLDDPALAEDALQETFFRVHEHLDRYDAGRPFRPWLLTIARNVALNALRARRKACAPPQDEPERAVSDRVARHTAAREDARAARAALAALDDDDRALLVMRHGLGLKLDDLAAVYGCTERTVRNRLQAALDRLTRKLLEGGRS
ncbi:MAG: sigma-70 family RNA polymerase sigma factor [Planctomycetes bacterium]|nr:sigma-70 family RNA polymerase sigma factor [Planctomycetota bacterium]